MLNPINDDFFKSISSMFNDQGFTHRPITPIKKSDETDPFKNFEVVVDGKKVTDPKEIEKDKKMFQNMFKGFDFGFNPLSVAQNVHKMNSNMKNRYQLSKPKSLSKCVHY